MMIVRVDRKKMELIMANACLNTSSLAKLTGMPRMTVYNVISGRGVTTVSMGKVAKALGVSVEDILEEEEKE